MELNNLTIEQLAALKGILPPEKISDLMDKAMEAEKNDERILSEPIAVTWNDTTFDVKITDKVTGSLRSKLRKIAREYPRHKIKHAAESVKLKYRDHDGDEYFLRAKLLEEYPDISAEELAAYAEGTYQDDDYEQKLDIFYLKYFREIISKEGLDKENLAIIESPVKSEGGIDDFWNNAISLTEVRRLVTFFRKKNRI